MLNEFGSICFKYGLLGLFAETASCPEQTVQRISLEHRLMLKLQITNTKIMFAQWLSIGVHRVPGFDGPGFLCAPVLSETLRPSAVSRTELKESKNTDVVGTSGSFDF
jgi:hypothetical protein